MVVNSLRELIRSQRLIGRDGGFGHKSAPPPLTHGRKREEFHKDLGPLLSVRLSVSGGTGISACAGQTEMSGPPDSGFLTINRLVK